MIDRIHTIILKALGCALFGLEKPELNIEDVNAVIKESKLQAVFSCIYPVLKNDFKKLMPSAEFTKLENEFLIHIANSIRVNAEHVELHRLMTEKGIPYVILKGCASSSYYDEPFTRTMGDVDFLVYEHDVENVIKALEGIGFKRDEYEFTTNQSAYHRGAHSVWEIHKSVTGIPSGVEGEIIKSSLSDIIETADVYEKDGLVFRCPNITNHGVVLLLHKASHMTTSGIGLRHLCDWAVFESKLSSDEFTELFEDKLKRFGLWRFAQIMTLLCEKYLGVPDRQWAHENEITEDELEDLMIDVLTAGNFGQKDVNRQREIKYITDRKEGKLGNKGMVSQVIKSLNDKVCNDYRFINKYKVFLPLGWIMEAIVYTKLIIQGKRKCKGTVAVLKEASKRKEIYSKLNLFETDIEV